MTTQHPDWLAQTVEAPLEPNLPICDPHHHLWDRPGHRYLLDELSQDLAAGHNVARTAFVECHSMYRKDGPGEMSSVGETEFVQGIAALSASGQYGPASVAAGIVGFADLTLGNAAAPVLQALGQASPNRLRGIRNTATWDASPEISSQRANPPGLLLDPRFREGFSLLQENGLSFDTVVYHTQLMDLVDLAQAFPNVTIVMNHIGRPIGIGPYRGKRDQVFQAWKDAIPAVAACPNVVVKVGGLGNPVSGFDWHLRDVPPGSAELAETVAPYYLYTIEQFGPGRCMFESNFPVDKDSYSYTVLWNALKLISKDFSATEKAALFHDTASRVYRL